MKNLKLLSLGVTILFLTLLALAGCGIPQADYDTLLAQKTALEAEKQTLQTNYNSLQTENKALQAQKSTLETEKQTLTADNSQLNSDLTSTEAELDTVKAAKASLQTQYDATNDELTNIKKVYPPKDFSSRSELENWLMANAVSEKPDTTDAESWIGRALELQEDALLDGYIVSVDYDYNQAKDTYNVYCTTVINGYVWYWDPETDDVSQDTNLIAVK